MRPRILETCPVCKVDFVAKWGPNKATGRGQGKTGPNGHYADNIKIQKSRSVPVRYEGVPAEQKKEIEIPVLIKQLVKPVLPEPVVEKPLLPELPHATDYRAALENMVAAFDRLDSQLQLAPKTRAIVAGAFLPHVVMSKRMLGQIA